jgi:type I restriction enzyme S subunit
MKQGWEIKNFEDCIVKVRNTTKIPKKKFLNDGAYPIISQENEFINGYWDNEDDIFRVEKPLVIFGDHTKKVKYVDFNFVMGADGIKVLQPIDDINARFFFYQIQSLPIEDLGYARHFRLLKKQYISIPPLDEQKRIVVKLDECFEAIDKARANVEKNLNNAKELFQSQLNQIFSQKGEGWVEKKLGEVAEVIAGQSPKGKYYNDKGVGLPFYQGKKLFGEKHLDEPNTWSSVTTKESYAGDIVMSVRAPVGDVNFNYHKKICIGRGLAGIRAGETVNKDYLFYFLIHHKNKIVGNTGAVFNSINKTQISNIIIPMVDLAQQNAIVNQLDDLKSQTQSLESNYQQELDALDELKKSILQKAFNGEL